MLHEQYTGFVFNGRINLPESNTHLFVHTLATLLCIVLCFLLFLQHNQPVIKIFKAKCRDFSFRNGKLMQIRTRVRVITCSASARHKKAMGSMLGPDA